MRILCIAYVDMIDDSIIQATTFFSIPISIIKKILKKYPILTFSSLTKFNMLRTLLWKGRTKVIYMNIYIILTIKHEMLQAIICIS